MKCLVLLGLLLLPFVAAADDGAGHWFGGPPTEWVTMDVGPLNAKADAAGRAEWTLSPLRLVLGIFGDDTETGNTLCEVRKPTSEGARSATVTLIHDGNLDDSTRSSWIEVECRITDDGTWRIAGARSARRCWRAPDREAWTARPCP